jgi:AsmA family protein
VRVTPEGYTIDNLAAQTGSSSLEGKVVFNTKKLPPQLSATFSSKRIQLTDFKSDFIRKNDSQTQGKMGNQAANSDIKHLTDLKTLQSYNAEVLLNFKEILSGKDYLGNGILKIQQKEGQLLVDPLRVSLPKGDIDIRFSVNATKANRHYTLDTAIDNLDYGVLARWFKPDTDVGGVINLRSSLESESQDFSRFMANASGYIDFCVIPEKLMAGVIDLWAVNLLSFLAPILNPDNSSVLNCAAGQFDVKDGTLSHRDMLIDTTKIQVKGQVDIDFKKGWIEAILRPVPKRPQFYSLATPVKISGELAKLKVGLSKGGAIGTIIRFMTSYVVVPIQWIILDKIPKDNREQCLEYVGTRSTMVN